MRHRVLPSVVLAVVALVLTVAIAVGWNLIFAGYYGEAVADLDHPGRRTGYWILMAVGDLFLATVITAIAIFLALTIRRGRRLRLQDAFIDRVTHELRTPIAALRLAVDTCIRRDLDTPTLRAQLHAMRGDLDRLQDLVDHVIDAGRIEHGEWRASEEQVDLAALAADCCRRVRQRYDLPDEAVRHEISPALGSIAADRVALEHILVNLLDNAVKYSDGPPDVLVSAAPEDGATVIRVRDRGVGIPPREATRIFRRFHRVGTERKRPGTGLGLYVVSQLCRQLGGRITAGPNPAGGGTVFTIRLPREGRRG